MGMVLGFFVSLMISMYFLYLSANRLHILNNLPKKLHVLGCRAMRPRGFWRLYIPSLILHVSNGKHPIVVMLTCCPFDLDDIVHLDSRQSPDKPPFIKTQSNLETASSGVCHLVANVPCH